MEIFAFIILPGKVIPYSNSAFLPHCYGCVRTVYYTDSGTDRGHRDRPFFLRKAYDCLQQTDTATVAPGLALCHNRGPFLAYQRFSAIFTNVDKSYLTLTRPLGQIKSE